MGDKAELALKTIAILSSAGLALWALAAAFGYATLPNLAYMMMAVVVLALTLTELSRMSTSRKLRLQQLKIDEVNKSAGAQLSLLNNLPVGVYRATADGKILHANHQFAQILGYKNPSDLQNINLNDVYTNKLDRREHLEKLRKESVFAEFELQRADGRTVWVREYPKATLNVNGRIEFIDGIFVEMHGIDAIMRDITEHRHLQNMKSHFIVAVTHELRTPLVSIKGYVDHILTKEGDLSGDLRSKIEVVKRNTDRLLELTNDLLSVQDVETGRLEFKFETLDLQEVIRNCLEEIQPLLRDRGQEVRLEIPGKSFPVVSDRLRLNEILMNLLTNANKFSPNGGSIIIRVEEDGTIATVSVSDSGIGIDKSDLERVFEPFATIEKPRYFKGTGLGLSLTRKLVEAQGGTIWATSIGKGQGSTFAFTLPKSREEWVKVHG